MEAIENLGEYFKNIREERKISLAQVAQEFKTKVEYVQAVESNNFSVFPAPTYVKGFLRSYAKYLELDADEVLAEYNKAYTQDIKQELVLKSKEIPAISLRINKNKLILWILLSAVIIALLTAGITWVFKTVNFIKTENKEQNAIIEKIAPKVPEIALPITAPIELTAVSADNVWIRVYSDDKLIFEGILAKNETKSWQADKEFRLRIGNPAKLNLKVNGQDLGQVAPYGPVNITINEKGVKAED